MESSDNNINRLNNLVWNNNYLKSYIINQLNDHYYYGLRKFETIQELLNFENIIDLYQIQVNFDINDQVLSILPKNIKSITVPSTLFYVSPDALSNSPIQSLHLIDSEENKGSEDLDIFRRVEYLDSLRFLKITCGKHNSGYPEINNLPFFLEELSIEIPTYQHSIADGVFPSSLKKIYLRFSKISLIDNSFIPYDSLTSLVLYGDISIPFGYEFPSYDVLLNLELLGHINVHRSRNDIAIKFPSSLENLRIQQESQEIPNPYSFTSDMFPTNLKSLSINISCFTKMGKSILPPNLESFTFVEGYFHLEGNIGVILADGTPFRFPESMKHLNLGKSFNSNINVGVLPNGLKTLILGKYFKKVVNPASIPHGLELLEIRYPGSYFDQLPLLLSNPKTIVSNMCYHIQFESNTDNITHYKVPYKRRNFEEFNLMGTLRFADNLEYLDLDNKYFNDELTPGKTIPANNKIKTLVLGKQFNKSINLDDFKQLEVLIINNSNPTLSTSHLNYYNLKDIIVPYNNSKFLDSVNKIFIPFIKVIKPKDDQIQVKYK